jgi:predicted molibdopterin-dependent oxidoreductase YjgC
MFRRRPHSGEAIRLTVDGEAIEAVAGDSVAAALLAAGRLATRETPVSGAPRGPHCLIGNCFDCLVEIDGRPNRQACMVAAEDGMQVRRQRGPVRLMP